MRNNNPILVDYFNDVFQHPEKYDVIVDHLPCEDENNKCIMRSAAFIYKRNSTYKKYDRVDDPLDIERLLLVNGISVEDNRK